MTKNYFVYILCSKRNGTLYVGVTSDLSRRIHEHKQKLVPGFTSKYNVNLLVYFEHTSNVHDALNREKQMKGWTRIKKIELIESINPKWEELDPSLRSE